MSSYVCYLASGKIVQASEIPREVLDMARQDFDGRVLKMPPGQFDTLNINRIFVDMTGPAPLIRERRPLDTAHTVSGLAVFFNALPPGLTLHVGTSKMTADGDDEIEFELPGTYTIELSGLVEYQDETLEVTLG